MSGKGFPRVQRVECPADGPERAAPKTLQRWVQKLRRHVMQKPLHNTGRALQGNILLRIRHTT